MPWNFPYRGETDRLDDTARAGASGEFIRLVDGITHYELGGPDSPAPEEKGQGAKVPVVLVHGFSVPYYIWDPTFYFLTKSNFRVLRYDLFGRGLSDRPRIRYDIHLFVRQLADLLEALDFESVNLVGLSMGGPISASFTERYPERVQKLALIDPAGVSPVTPSRVLKAVMAPGFGELTMGLMGGKMMVKSIASDFFDAALVAEFRDRYLVQMKYKGFLRAILSTIRSGMLGSFTETYRRLGKQKTPVLLIWGRQDVTVPFEHSQELRAAVPQAEFHAIEECGHIPHYERPQVVNPILLEFLK